MGRYRPPAPPKSKYITPQGFEKLNQELIYLWRVKRFVVTQAVSEAAAQGDRSENAEYIYGKKQLREIDSRIRYLQKRLDDIVVVSDPPSDPNKIFFGAWVVLENELGEDVCYRIVGPDETDSGKGWISMDAPLAKALFKKTIDDEIEVQLPKGHAKYWVMEIHYQEPV
ncbi:MAG: transcription elongation factor GreB [Gammaproteobacteria bacterium]|nr:transcription elongation factor GreB [Gammaproteobacteria bacterium]